MVYDYAMMNDAVGYGVAYDVIIYGGGDVTVCDKTSRVVVAPHGGLGFVANPATTTS